MIEKDINLYEDTKCLDFAMRKLNFSEEDLNKASIIYQSIISNIPIELRNKCFLRYEPERSEDLFTCLIQGKNEYRCFSLPFNKSYPLKLIYPKNRLENVEGLRWKFEFKKIDCILLEMSLDDALNFSNKNWNDFNEACKIANNSNSDRIIKSNSYFKEWLSDSNYYDLFKKLVKDNIHNNEAYEIENFTTEAEFNNRYVGATKRAAKLSNDVLLCIVKNRNRPSRKIQVNTSVYERDPFVTLYAKKRANGVCQLCNEEAPFKNREGEPYLEVHHIKWLSRGGDDSIKNTTALCPNCHRRMHALNLQQDIDYLMNKID